MARWQFHVADSASHLSRGGRHYGPFSQLRTPPRPHQQRNGDGYDADNRLSKPFLRDFLRDVSQTRCFDPSRSLPTAPGTTRTGSPQLSSRRVSPARGEPTYTPAGRSPTFDSAFSSGFLNRVRMFDSCREHSQSLYPSRFSSLPRSGFGAWDFLNFREGAFRRGRRVGRAARAVAAVRRRRAARGSGVRSPRATRLPPAARRHRDA